MGKPLLTDLVIEPDIPFQKQLLTQNPLLTPNIPMKLDAAKPYAQINGA